MGDSNSRTVRVRVIAATNQDLEAMARKGEFLPDLIHRLGVMRLNVPPLSERHEDILALARYFLDAFRKELKSIEKAFSAAAEAALEGYPWPGNARELSNAIKRAIILSAGNRMIETADLELPTQPSDVGP